MEIDLHKVYEENIDFKEWVDKYADNKNLSVDTVLSFKSALDVAEYYLNR